MSFLCVSLPSLYLTYMLLSIRTTLQYYIFQRYTSHVWNVRLDVMVCRLLTVGLYVLTWLLLRGGGPGDSVNLASIPSTQLSQAYVFHCHSCSAYR